MEEGLSRIQRLGLTTKILFIIVIVIVSYLSLVIIFGLFLQQPFSMHNMPHMMNPSQNSLAIVALPTALFIGVLFAILFKLENTDTKTSQVDELEIMKKALSDDEKAVINEIQRAGEITQDSLRFRLDWSKAKLSRILTLLDKMNIIQRERVGKTYNVFLTKKKEK